MRTDLSRAHARLLLVAGCLAPLQACTQWRVDPLPPAQLVEQRQPGQVELRRHDGVRIVLARPWVDGDSVAGLQGADTTRVAFADVGAVAVRRFSLLRSAGLTIVTTALALGIACALACDFEIGLGY